ncbi:MAG: SOS response-associated peptidase [Oscillospiraceae bacterium]|jgi:putative SOS response-associated peptidase YedK|nr:SOS response-associated peptidase [Oscillospiraceae bacterium]
MCGRYLIEIDEEELKEIIATAEVNARGRSEQFSFAFRGGEIFPGSVVPVIAGNNEVRFMTWGFPGIIVNQPPHINARSETAAASRTFGEAMASRRCLVPASGYYEWKTRDKKHKVKYKFTLPSGTMYMAGVYSADGRFAILTRSAAPDIVEFHDRMPVILPKSLLGVWLRESPHVLKEAITDLKFAQAEANDKQPEQMSLFNQK